MKYKSKLLVLLSVLFLLILSMGILCACGRDKNTGELSPPPPPPSPYGLEFTALNNYKCSVSKGKATNTKINIPEEYDGKKVVEIKSAGFSNFSELESISIPNTVKKIEENAFKNCANLKTVTIKDGIEEIEANAFANCKQLESISIPNSVTKMGRSVFSGCSSLSSISLPFIGDKKEELEDLEELEASASTLFGYIFGSAKYEGSKETTQYYSDNSSAVYYIPEKLERVTVLGGYLLYGAFYNCSNIKLLTLGSVWIEQNALYGVDNIETANIPSRVIPHLYKGKLKNLTISGSGNIPREAFSECESLETVTIGNGVEVIGEDAFSVCWNLKSVVISDSVTRIESGAFGACPNLSAVKLGNGLLVIGDEAFGCCGLESIVIPAKVASIGDYAFSNCLDLVEVEIGSGLKSIGYQAFYNCEKLSNVVFSETSRWEAIKKDDESNQKSISDLEDSSAAAMLLKNTYCDYYWKRS